MASVATLGTATPAVLQGLGYLILVESIVVFVQVAVLAVHAYTMGQKKKLLEHQARVAGGSAQGMVPSQDDDNDSNNVALLAIPDDNKTSPSADIAPPSASANPLLQW